VSLVDALKVYLLIDQSLDLSVSIIFIRNIIATSYSLFLKGKAFAEKL